MSIYHLLNGRNYGTYNRLVAREIGLVTTVMLSELLDEYEYFKMRGELVEFPNQAGKWFYATREKMEERTTLSRKEQDTQLEKLVELGFIEKIVKGIPPRRYFRINEEKISEFLLNLKNNYYIVSGGQNDMSPKDKINCAQETNSPIYINHIKEPDKEGASPPSSPPFVHNRVKIEHSKYVKLLLEFGSLEVASYVEKLDEYADINPKRFKQYACHAAVIRKWIREEWLKKGMPQKRLETDQILLNKLKKYSETYPTLLIDCGADYVVFSKISPTTAYKIGEAGFKEKIISCLRKMNVNVTEERLGLND